MHQFLKNLRNSSEKQFEVRWRGFALKTCRIQFEHYILQYILRQILLLIFTLDLMQKDSQNMDQLRHTLSELSSFPVNQ